MECSKALLDLRQQLYKEIDEESKAGVQYENMAKTLAESLSENNLMYLSWVVSDISLDERKHHLILKGLVDAITQECGG